MYGCRERNGGMEEAGVVEIETEEGLSRNRGSMCCCGSVLKNDEGEERIRDGWSNEKA